MRRRHKRRVVAEVRLGLAWYTRAGWERLRELAADRDALDSFEGWERGALAAIGELHRRRPQGPPSAHRCRGTRGLVPSSRSTARWRSAGRVRHSPPPGDAGRLMSARTLGRVLVISADH